MSKHGSLDHYNPPRVVDYGDLVAMTASAHLLMGAAVTHDLSFSAPVGSGGVGGVQGQGGAVVPAATTGSASATGDPGGSGTLGASAGGDPGGSGSGSGSGGGGGGGTLPFTGFAAAGAAAIGGGLAAAGAALRRAFGARRGG